ncbi:hypothetical protein [Mycobacterium sp. E2479]|uniref:hypothetical protein n=1 Tax=Mycobacterium sp. E2479 TaxID=1834134 RepID=UPI001E2B841B|nr:hypothetical protein [Mycobacterium sp. E2479]
MLAWLLVVELLVVAAVPFDAVRESRIRPAQLVMPAPSQIGASTKSITLGDRTVRLLGLGGPASDRLLARVAANMGAAISAVESFWGVDWPHEIAVVAAGTDEEFRAAAGGGPASQWADIAAVTVVDRLDPVRRVAAGERIVFAPGAAAMSATSLRIVLAHELFHYAARADTVTDAPRWLTEGVADFVGRPPAPVPADSLLPMTLPTDGDLDEPGTARSLAYDRAWWFARFVADAYGPPKLRDLYLATCGIRHTDMAAAAQELLGTSPAGLLMRWQQWLTH